MCMVDWWEEEQVDGWAVIQQLVGGGGLIDGWVSDEEPDEHDGWVGEWRKDPHRDVFQTLEVVSTECLKL